MVTDPAPPVALPTASPRVDPGFGHILNGSSPVGAIAQSPWSGPAPSAPVLPGNSVAPIYNRGAYTGEGDNTNGDWAHFNQIVRQLWPQYGGNFGPGAKPPPNIFDAATQPGVYAEAYPSGFGLGDTQNGGGIVWSPGAVGDVAHSNSAGHDNGLGAIFHETAHTFQSPQTFAGGPPSYEGGATAFANTVGQRAVNGAGLVNGGHVGGLDGQYGVWARQVRAWHPGSWITQGQFSTPSSRAASVSVARLLRMLSGY